MRLTEKSNQGYIYKASCPDGFGFVVYDEYPIQKLGQYEDIEEELGIDLVTLFKAQQQGIWVKSKRTGIEYGKEVLIGNTSIHCSVYSTKYASNRGRSYKTKSIKDYGKTWSLDKKDLMKEELL